MFLTLGFLHGFGQFLFWMELEIPENPDFKYYYPTNDLVTGPDILFFWVARMIVSGLNLKIKSF